MITAIVMRVEEVEAWHRHARAMRESGEYPDMRIKSPEAVDNSLVLHVVDPSDVLLVFVQ
jgi:hypothetical protein